MEGTMATMLLTGDTPLDDMVSTAMRPGAMVTGMDHTMLGMALRTMGRVKASPTTGIIATMGGTGTLAADPANGIINLPAPAARTVSPGMQVRDARTVPKAGNVTVVLGMQVLTTAGP